jgi:hypothetical protein
MQQNMEWSRQYECLVAATVVTPEEQQV